MDVNRLTDWLKSVGGATTALTALVAALSLLYAAISDQLSKFLTNVLGVSAASAQYGTHIVAFLLYAPVLWVVWRSWRRFATASRLERPEAFTLVATTPDTLIGRAEDLQRLRDTVLRHRIVLLDGESGCGKSALIAAGLVPELSKTGRLLPVLIRDWGTDAERGPMASALGAAFESLTPEQRMAIDWTSAPDLAAETTALAADMETRFAAIIHKLGKRPLLIADQFDDYQGQHRQAFVDNGGNWLTPGAVAASNAFWAMVCRLAAADALHLLAVARADTASGLSCLRFLDSERIAVSQLPRVESEFLRPLLANVAPDTALPPVVSQPEGGWHDLRSLLEESLHTQGAILMQQVRTVLLGLRQLPLLTVRAYRRAGELRGVETLAVARAVRRAADAAGGGKAGESTARKVLGALVQPGGPNQPAKALRRESTELQALVGSAVRVVDVLRVLQQDELVRPAHGAGAWQLDHDYLAGAVLAEARGADRWATALQEGRLEFERSEGDWRRRWTRLLPMTLQLRLLWERLRGRLLYGGAASYALISLLKPALAVMLAGATASAAAAWLASERLTADAVKIYDRFGGPTEDAATVEAWRASEAVRRRLFVLVRGNADRLARATRSRWPIAHAGLEPAALRESMEGLREQLASALDKAVVQALVPVYASVVERVSDQTALKREVEEMRTMLARETNVSIAWDLAEGYVAAASNLSDQSTLGAEAKALVAQLSSTDDANAASSVAAAYAAVASKFIDQAALGEAAELLRERLFPEPGTTRSIELSRAKYRLARAYVTVASRLVGDQGRLAESAAALRADLSRSSPSESSDSASPYFEIVTHLSGQSALSTEAAALRTLLARRAQALSPGVDDYHALLLTNAYRDMVAKLMDEAALIREADELRSLLTNVGGETQLRLARVYPLIVKRLSERKSLLRHAEPMSGLTKSPQNVFVAAVLSQAQATAVAALSEPLAVIGCVEALRARLAEEQDSQAADAYAVAYAIAVAAADAGTLSREAAAWRGQFMRETDDRRVDVLLTHYVAVTSKMSDQAALEREVEALRERVVREPGGSEARVSVGYATAAARMSDRSALARAAGVLRDRLSREPANQVSPAVIRSYAGVVVALSDQKALGQILEMLRARLPKSRQRYVPSEAEGDYVEVVGLVSDRSVLATEATVLRRLLLSETKRDTVDVLAWAYAAVARRDLALLKTADDGKVSNRVREILTLAGHPLLKDVSTFIDALEPTAGPAVKSGLGGVAEWWASRFGGDVTSLRPRADD